MTNAQTVFELAMHLMDETRSTGAVDTTETRGYKVRVVPILNVLRSECHPCSDAYQLEEGGRPISPVIEDLDSPIGLDDGICQGVLPYGLAAHLLLGEDDQRAGYFQQRYEEKLAQLGRTVPARQEAIEMPYGGIEFGSFAHW